RKQCRILIKGKNERQLQFEADSPEEKEAWCTAIREGIFNSIAKNNFQRAKTFDLATVEQLELEPLELTENQTVLESIRLLPGNRHCADCGMEDPQWVSLNLSVLVCISCAGVHRELGTHLSKIRSLDLDSIPDEQMFLLRHTGNMLSNGLWYNALSEGEEEHFKSPNWDYDERKSHIQEKYVRRYYFVPVPGTEDEINEKFQTALSKNDVTLFLHILISISSVADSSSQDRKKQFLELTSQLSEKGFTQIVEWQMTSLSCAQASKSMRSKVYLCKTALVSAVSGFLFGYDTGVISGAMIQLRQIFSLDYLYQELVISVTIIAAALFAFISGPASERFGRSPILKISSLLFLAGSVIIAIAHSTTMLLIGRFVVGCAIGLSSMITPMYLAECAPVSYRGLLITLNTLFITGGQFLASLLDGALYYNRENGWRYMLGLAAIPAAIQFIGLFFLDESPRWLALHGRPEEARAVLKKIYDEKFAEEDDSIVEKELSQILQSSLQQEEEHESEEMQDTTDPSVALSHKRKVRNSWLKMFTSKGLLKAMAIGCGLQLFQQLSGINTVMYYGASILSMAGMTAGAENESSVVWLAALVAFMNFAFSVLGMYLVNKMRRRTLLISSLICVSLSLVLLGAGFKIIEKTSSQVTVDEAGGQLGDMCHSSLTCDQCVQHTDQICGYCFEVDPTNMSIVNGSCARAVQDYATQAIYGRCSNTSRPTNIHWIMDACPTKYSWMILIGLVFYLMGFAPGMGHLPWIINVELYPNWARSNGNALAVATNWLANLIISMTFLTMTASLTRYGTFFLFAGFAILGAILSYLFVPETKGISIDEITIN
ncbi:hypothetical protein Ciccas_007710, partial [Cichlidogyrus casuarinus]